MCLGVDLSSQVNDLNANAFIENGVRGILKRRNVRNSVNNFHLDILLTIGFTINSGGSFGCG